MSMGHDAYLEAVCNEFKPEKITMEVQGTIENVSFKEGTGARGAWKKASVQINGEWYGAFENASTKDAIAKVIKGSEVVVVYEKDKSGKYNNFTDIKVSSVSSAPAGQSPQTASQPSGAPLAVNHSQYRMSHAGGRNAAVGIVTAALAHDAQFPFEEKESRILSLPKPQNKRLDALVALVGTIGTKLGMDNWLAEPTPEEDNSGYEE